MVSSLACLRASLFLFTAWFRSVTWGWNKIVYLKHLTTFSLDLHIAFVCPSKISCTDLRLVPFLCLGDILGSDSLVLYADVLKGGSQVWFGHVHLDLHLTLLHLVLQLTDLLKETVNRETWFQSAYVTWHVEAWWCMKQVSVIVGNKMWLSSMESRMLNVKCIKCTLKYAGSLLMVPWRTFNINGTFQLHKRYSVKMFLQIIKTLVLLRMVLQWHCCENTLWSLSFLRV